MPWIVDIIKYVDKIPDSEVLVLLECISFTISYNLKMDIWAQTSNSLFEILSFISVIGVHLIFSCVLSSWYFRQWIKDISSFPADWNYLNNVKNYMMFEFRLNAAVKPSEPATLFGYGYWTIHNFLLFWVNLGILCFDNKLSISQKISEHVLSLVCVRCLKYKS